MAIPLKLPSFDSCKHVFVWANCMIDPSVYLLFCDVLFIRCVEECLVASPRFCLYSLKVGDECPCFACIQEDQYRERMLQTGL